MRSSPSGRWADGISTVGPMARGNRAGPWRLAGRQPVAAIIALRAALRHCARAVMTPLPTRSAAPSRNGLARLGRRSHVDVRAERQRACTRRHGIRRWRPGGPDPRHGAGPPRRSASPPGASGRQHVRGVHPRTARRRHASPLVGACEKRLPPHTMGLDAIITTALHGEARRLTNPFTDLCLAHRREGAPAALEADTAPSASRGVAL